jgi:hypothetical protein
MPNVSPEWVRQSLDIGTALAAGLLIGIERGWKLKNQKPGTRVAGVRTFTMLGLASGIAGLTGALGYPLVAAALATGAVALMVIAYSRQLEDRRDDDRQHDRRGIDEDHLLGTHRPDRIEDAAVAGGQRQDERGGRDLLFGRPNVPAG